MKRLIAFFMIAMMITVFGSCKKNDTQNDNGTADGGWTISEDETAVVLPEEVQKAFEKATETLTGETLTPVAFTGQQVVAGMNYMLLCRAVPSVSELAEPAVYQMIVIYADLQGNAEITQMNDFDFASYSEGNGTDPSGEKLSGGWTVPEKHTKKDIPEQAQKAFDKAVEGFTGNSLDPMVLLGTQLVSGTNYMFLCHSSLTTAEPVESIQIVTVYEDLEGNAEITNIHTLDLSEFNK